MVADFAAAFAALKPVLVKYENRMSVKKDSSTEYTLVSTLPSPFPQHKGHPLEFASVRVGKAYVSFHLMSLYFANNISPALAKRKQGKTCLNFQGAPGPELIAELESLTKAGFENWREKKWL